MKKGSKSNDSEPKKPGNWPEEHTHDCEWCGRPIECSNGTECELDQREGHCTQECYDHKTPRG